MRSLSFWTAFWVLLPLSQFFGVNSQFIQNPTFSFRFNPPCKWTYLTPGYRLPGDTTATFLYPGQWATQNDAQRAMENDIQSAVLRATQAVGMYGGFPRPVPSGYTPFEAFIVTNSSDTTNRKPGTYFGELGAITIQRTVLNQDGGTPVDLSIRVNGLLANTKEQWTNVAGQMFMYLSTGSHVRFLGPITVR